MYGDILVGKKVALCGYSMIYQIAFGGKGIDTLNTPAAGVCSENHLLCRRIFNGNLLCGRFKVEVVQTYRSRLGLDLVRNGRVLLIQQDQWLLATCFELLQLHRLYFPSFGGEDYF